MVHVYNCHPFASQHIVPTEQEPGPVCCGSDVLFVVSAGGCKVDAYHTQRDGCSLICRFATMGSVKSILHSPVGDYLVTIEEKNNATYLRAYTNWRYQAAEKTRVGVRLLGHLLRGSSFRGAPKEQMEIIEIPLFEPPMCMSCCMMTGDLLVGCAKSLVIFSLKRQTLSEQLCALDFERFLILHLHSWTPLQVAFCAGFVALRNDLEVLVLKLERFQSVMLEEHALVPKDIIPRGSEEDTDARKEKDNVPMDAEDFCMIPKNQELLGEDANECGIRITLEWTGMEAESTEHLGVTYVLYRRFSPDFYQGCSVEETSLHSLQLLPFFTTNEAQEEDGETSVSEPSCIFCFFSLPNDGYMYSIKNSVELVSVYQYPEKAQQAVLSELFLHIITRNALHCFSVRCSAVAARVVDPYIDTTMKACPHYNMEVCAFRIQLFIGLKAICRNKSCIVLLTAADVESNEESERGLRRSFDAKDHKTLTGIFLAAGIEPSTTPGLESLLSRPFLSKRTSVSTQRESSESRHGWNIYVINTVSTIPLYREMVEYSKKYECNNPMSQSCLHLLSEAHLLLRATLLDPWLSRNTDKQQLQDAFSESCVQLGDCYSRFDKRDSHLALPYYKMSGLSVTDIIRRNMAFFAGTSFGKGFIFYLKHSLYEDSVDELSKETADSVLDIFSRAEPSQLTNVISCPPLQNASPDLALAHLDKLEAAGSPSVIITLTKAALALRMGNAKLCKQQMDRHAEMLQVYGFIEEPKLLAHGRGKNVLPTILSWYLKDTQEGLLVAAMVALHENNKVKLEETELFFQELCKDGAELESGPQLLVDFWEALLVASSSEAVIQELLFRLSSVYIDRIARKQTSGMKPLKTVDDLISSCSHYGLLFPWVSVITPSHFNITSDNQEDLQKLQSLLCGPTLDVSSVLPLLEQLPGTDTAGLSIHVLCATKLGQHEHSIDRLLDFCPQAILPYANHELQHDKMVLWWKKLFPELCERTRLPGSKSPVLHAALTATLGVIAKELGPVEFLDILPDDGTAEFFLPHLLECSQRTLTT